MRVAPIELPATQQESRRSFFFRESRARTALLATILIAGVIAVYLPVRDYSFFNLDDHAYVVDNEHVHRGLNWTTITWAFRSSETGNWIPLSLLSHALDWQLFGPDPAGHHAVNVLLHALDAALLFWVLKRATGYVGRSFMVAALFALHPLNVEAVAWVAERKTVLSMLFFLLALGAYQWYAREPRDSRYRAVALLFALGLTAKAQVITLPCVFLLWDYWPLQRMSLGQELSPETKVAPLPQRPLAWLLSEKLSLMLVAAAATVFTIFSQGGTRVRQWAPLSQRLANAVFSYTQYLAKAFWPSNMAPMYPNRGASLSGWEVGGACVLLVAITALVVAGRRHRYLPMGWFWFLGTLVPMLQIVQFGREGMADRFAYQALIGLFIMVCWGLSDSARQRRISTAWLACGGAVALLALTLVTQRQMSYWRNPSTMWWHAATVVKGHWMGEAQIGNELLLAGKTNEGLQHIGRALAFKPDDALANISMAAYDRQHGNQQDAVLRYQNALQDWVLGPQDKANVNQSMGYAYRDMGELSKAQECFDKAAEWRKIAEDWRERRR